MPVKKALRPEVQLCMGEVVHELGALLSDAVDIGRFAKPDALMVDARLHPADVVAHDEENVGFLPLGLLLLLGGGRNARHCRGGAHHDKSAPDFSGQHPHGCFLRVGCRSLGRSLHPTISGTRNVALPC